MSLRVPARLHSQSLIAIHAFLTRQRLGRSLVRGAAIALLCLGAAGARAATCTVTSTADSNTSSPNTLRYCLNHYSSGDTINITANGTITLGSSLPYIVNGVTITGPGADLITVSGAGAYEIFNISGGTVSISGLTLANGNPGGISGGAIEISGGTVTIFNSTFSGNSSNSGGAIGMSGDTVTIYNSTFTGNSGTYGGAIYVDAGTANIYNSTFTGNSGYDGGAVFNDGGTLVVTNSTFFGNSVGSGGQGGAVLVEASTLTLSNSIFDGNRAPGSGGGIANLGSTINISYNVFYNNNGGDCSNCTSTNSIDASSNPLMLPLGYYGGTTQTYLPQPGSTAICAGLAAIDDSITTDQRGFPVTPSYPTCSSGSVDAGAVQTNYLTVRSAGDTAGFLCPDVIGSACTLRGAITQANSDTTEDIDFLSSLDGQTITLGTGGTDTSLPAITGQVNIIGPGANQLTISGNNDTNVGSVITVDSGATVALYGVTVANGNSIGGPGGGGINNAGALTVMASAVSSNYTGLQGGGVFNNGKLAVTDSTVSGNTASFGGGIASWGTLTVTESTFSGNTANGVDGTTAEGGGIYNLGTVTLSNSTVSGNSATCSDCYANGGGVSLFAGTLTASNSIVAGNSASSTGGYIAQYADITGSYTDNGGNVANGNISATSPYQGTVLLSALLYNGIGATVQTMIPLPGSPAICAGLSSNIPSGTTTDERGYSLQPTNGYCPSGSIDAGAVQTNYTGVQWAQQPPATTYALSDISPAPTVAMLETDTLLSSNNTDAVNGVPVTISFNGPGALNGTLSETTSGGVATYGDLSPTDAAMNDVLLTDPITITSGVTLSAVPSSSFDVIGDLSQFIVSAPATAVAGTPFNVTVTAEDAAGNTVTNFSELLIVSSSDGSIVESPLAGFVGVTNGVGTFQATLHAAGSQTISASELVFPNYSGTSGTITVSAASPAILTASAGTPQSAYVNVAFATALTATVTDPYGNPIPSATVNFTAPSSGASAALSNAGSCVTASNGSCSVTATANGTAGSYNVTAAVSGLSSLGSVSFALTNSPLTPRFVATTGSDTGDCSTSGSPCATIGYAVSEANPYDTINVAAGTYNEHVTISQNVTIQGSLTGSTIVDGGGAGRVFTIIGSCTVALNNLTITNGHVKSSGGPAEYGGGIENFAGTLTVTDSTISSNAANGGGGIFNGGTLAVLDSTVSTNDADHGGGIDNTGTLTVTNSTFSGNSAGGNGGGIESTGTLTVTESTFSGNAATGSAGSGGGIYNDGLLTLTAITVSGNSAAGSGGGISNGASGAIIVFNTIVAGNTAPTAPDFSSGAIVSEQHNLIGNGAGASFVNGINGDQVGGGPPPLNPQISSLQLNGIGATVKTLIPLPGSPAICAGSASLVPPGTTTDERGYPLQPTNGYCPSGSIDEGAVQTNYTSVAFVQQPTNVDFPAAISPSPTVEILETDALLTSNNTDAVNGAPLTLTYSNGSGDISGSLTQATASGVATFTNLTPQTTGDDFSFTASVPITSAGSGTTLTVTSNPFDVISPANLMNFSPSPTPGATAGNTYSYQLSATGGVGPYTYSATGLAAGLQVLNSQIVGQCTGSSTNVYLTAYDSETPPQTVTAGPFSIACNAQPTITTTSLPSAFVNVPYSTTITESGGSGPPTAWTLNPSVTGFSIDPATGILSGTATSTGNLQFNITFTDMWGATDNKLLTLAVNNPPTYVVNTTTDDATGAASDCTPTEGTCTLRDALAAAQAEGAGIITFDSTVFLATNTTAQNTITLANGTLNIPSNTTIQGQTKGSGTTQSNLVTIAGGAPSGDFPVISVNSSATNALLANLTITGGYSTGGTGAGIVMGYQSELTVKNSTISKNEAPSAVGAIFNDYGATITILNSTISGNSGGAGGIVNEAGGSVFVISSTISGNTASSSGGAILNGGAAVTIASSTVVGNSAVYDAGGIFSNAGTVTITNSIVAGNTATSNADIDGTYTDSGGNIFGGTPASPIDPVLAPLGSYGGPTQTMIPLPGSPAICAGALANATAASITADQRGFIFDPICPIGIVDTGAAQANYALSFSTQPAVTEYSGQAFPVAVTLTESGMPLTAASETLPITLSAGTLAGTPVSANTVNGVASFSLTVSNPTALSGLTLTTGFTLNNPVTLLKVSNSFDLAPPIATTTTVAGNLTAPWSTSGQTVPLTVNVTASGATVSSGTLTVPAFVLVARPSGTTVRIVPRTIVYSGSPDQVDLSLPGGMAAGTYTLQVSYSDPTDVFASSSDSSHTLTVTTPNFVVTTAQDDAGSASNCTAQTTPGTGTDASCSLRDALLAAANSAGASVSFDSTAFSATNTAAQNTITLAYNSLILPTNTTITGPTTGSGATLTNLVTVNGNNQVTGFIVNATATGAAISNLNITNAAFGLQSGSKSLSGILVTNGGAGYTNPTVTINDPTGVGATATAAVTGGAIAAIYITNGGSGYTKPTITITDPTGSGATAAITLGSGIQNGGVLVLAGDSISNNSGIYGAGIDSAGTLTVSNGTISGNSAIAGGGGIYNTGPVTLMGTTISNNTVLGGGGGVDDVSGALTIGNSTISGNSSSAPGGGLSADGTLTVTNTTFSDNSVQSGGGALVASGTATVSLSTFISNSSGGTGGAIENAGTLTVAGSGFSKNTALGAGGAIENQGPLTVTGSTFSGNSVSAGTGGAIDSTSTVTLANTTFSGNATLGSGGGLNIRGGTATVTDSTFSGNSVSEGIGGAIYVGVGTLNVTNSIFTGGTSVGPGAGIANGATTNASYNVFYNNVPSEVPPSQGDCYGCTLDSTNLTGTTANPMLAPLGNYGGPTQTMIPLPGSAAICAGTLANATAASITADQRGFVFDPLCPSGSVDAGAVQTDYSIAFVQQPSTVLQGIVMLPSPTVRLDESGTAFFDGTYTIAIPLTLTTGTGTLTGGSASTSASTGIVTYSALSISAPGTGDQLTATLSLNPALSMPLSLTRASGTFTVNSAVTQLAFSTAPASAVTAGGNAGSSIVVDEENSGGTLATTANDTITLTVTGPNSYSKTYTQAAVNGVATFNLSSAALTAGGSYSYSASISGNASVSDATASETVSAATAAAVSVVSGSGQSAVIGVAFTAPLKVFVEDQYSNPVSGASVSFAGPVTGAGATFTGSPATTASDGTASVTAAANGTAGSTTYTVTASVSGASSASFLLTNTQQATTLTVTPSPASPVYGQPVTIVAAISPASVLTSAPTGSVTFSDGTTGLTPVSTVAGASASYTVSVPAVGSHTYAAQYGGDNNFKQSALTSAAAALVVSKASSTLTGPASPVSMTYGAGGTISVNISGQFSGAGIATPSGTVSYTIGSGSVQTAAISSGVATLTILTTQSARSYTVAVSYSGDGNYNAATAINVMLSVNQAKATITVTPYAVTYDGTAHTATGTATGVGGVNLSADLTLTATTHTAAGTYATDAWSFHDPNGNYADASGTVTDKIGPAAATITVTPYIVTYDGTAHTAMGTATGVGGVNLSADLTLTATTHTAAGTYATDAWSFHDPNGNYADASGTVTDKIGPATLTVTANKATKVYGTANPTFTGSVSGQQNGDAFVESFATSATLTSPVNTYAIDPSVTGTKVADYTQSITDGTLTITQAASTTSLNLSSTNITPLQSVTFTATVASTTTGRPTGTVSFYDNGTLLGSSVALSAGVAQYSTAALAPGITHTIVATYSGDVNFTGSSNTSTSTVIVAPLDFTVVISGPSSQTVVPGGTIVYQVTVTPDYGSYAGTVSFAVNGLPPGATVTFSPSSIAANGGPQTITVTIQTAPVTAALRATPTSTTPSRRATPFALAFLLLLGAGTLRKRGRVLGRLLCIVALLIGGAAATFTLSGCAGNGYFAQAPENYNITLTATAGNLEHTATFTLNVQ